MFFGRKKDLEPWGGVPSIAGNPNQKMRLLLIPESYKSPPWKYQIISAFPQPGSIQNPITRARHAYTRLRSVHAQAWKLENVLLAVMRAHTT